mgnify:CR=1 FL=1|tara:strand:+ start:186 stop:395 length:210 start_codon:yes stop_codon:yes gene_type:complete
MPYRTEKGTGKDEGKTCVYKKGSNKKVGCTDGPIKDYLAALHANANESITRERIREIVLEEINKILKKA